MQNDATQAVTQIFFLVWINFASCNPNKMQILCCLGEDGFMIHPICDFLLHIWLLGWLASSPRKVGGLFRLIPCIPST